MEREIERMEDEVYELYGEDIEEITGLGEDLYFNSDLEVQYSDLDYSQQLLTKISMEEKNDYIYERKEVEVLPTVYNKDDLVQLKNTTTYKEMEDEIYKSHIFGDIQMEAKHEIKYVGKERGGIVYDITSSMYEYSSINQIKFRSRLLFRAYEGFYKDNPYGKVVTDYLLYEVERNEEDGYGGLFGSKYRLKNIEKLEGDMEVLASDLLVSQETRGVTIDYVVGILERTGRASYKQLRSEHEEIKEKVKTEVKEYIEKRVVKIQTLKRVYNENKKVLRAWKESDLVEGQAIRYYEDIFKEDVLATPELEIQGDEEQLELYTSLISIQEGQLLILSEMIRDIGKLNMKYKRLRKENNKQEE